MTHARIRPRPGISRLPALRGGMTHRRPRGVSLSRAQGVGRCHRGRPGAGLHRETLLPDPHLGPALQAAPLGAPLRPHRERGDGLPRRLRPRPRRQGNRRKRTPTPPRHATHVPVSWFPVSVMGRHQCMLGVVTVKQSPD